MHSHVYLTRLQEIYKYTKVRFLFRHDMGRYVVYVVYMGRYGVLNIYESA